MPEHLTSLFVWQLKQLACIGLALLVLLALLHGEERLFSRVIMHRLGWRGLMITAWLGVPLHELGHLLFVWLFRHRLIEVKFFAPNPAAGTLGYVRHAYRRRSLWQLLGTFFIGLGPLFTGGLGLIMLFCWIFPGSVRASLLHHAASLSSSTHHAQMISGWLLLLEHFLGALWHERSWLLLLQIFLGVCVASHLAPSRDDFAVAIPGVLILILLAFIAAFILALLGTPVIWLWQLIFWLGILIACCALLQWSYMLIVFAICRR